MVSPPALARDTRRAGCCQTSTATPGKPLGILREALDANTASPVGAGDRLTTNNGNVGCLQLWMFEKDYLPGGCHVAIATVCSAECCQARKVVAATASPLLIAKLPRVPPPCAPGHRVRPA